MPGVTVFISHAPGDGQWVKRLAEGLARERVQVFLQERDIGPGQVELHMIEKAIGMADTAIVVLSAAAVADAKVNDEYAALFHEATSRGLRLIPVLYGAASIRVPPLTGTRLWADFRGLSQAEHDAKVAALAWVIQDPAPDTEPPADGVRLPPVEVLQAVRAAEPACTPPRPEFVITYAAPDAEYGERLRGWLRQSGLPAWSIAELKWGSRYVHEIRQRLRHALAVIVIMSPAAEDSEDVEREILEGQRHGREFFPVLLRGDRNFLLASSWYFDARDGALPGEPELRRLRRIHQALLSGRPVTHEEAMGLPVRAPVGSGVDGIPLRRLRALLKEQELTHADLLTTSLMLSAARRLDTGWMEHEDAPRLPASLLASIDEAWSRETGGQQGFQQQLDRYRIRSEHGTDFPDLAMAYGWKAAPGAKLRYGELGAMGKYPEFVDRAVVPAGFFPTLRNPQVETHTAWYDRWQSTVVAVHLRLRDWEKE